MKSKTSKTHGAAVPDWWCPLTKDHKCNPMCVACCKTTLTVAVDGVPSGMKMTTTYECTFFHGRQEYENTEEEVSRWLRMAELKGAQS